MGFLHCGSQINVQLPDPKAVKVEATSGPRKATPGDPNQLAAVVPGELLSYAVKPGDVLETGQPLCVLESKKVVSLPCKGRTKEKQGDILSPGDLLLEVLECE